MTNNQKSASVWLAYIEGWRVSFSKDKRKMPTATDDVLAKCEEMYRDHGKTTARKLAFEMGYNGTKIK